MDKTEAKAEMRNAQVVPLWKKDRDHGPNTPEAFRNFHVFRDASHKATVPRGYDLTVDGIDSSIDMGLGYLGVHLLEEYHTEKCALFCNDLPTCSSFNIYFERSPMQDPSIKDGCPNPESTTHIKCVLWRSELTKDSAINIGEIREEFEVVIAGSNLYNKQAGVLEVPNFNGPDDVDNHAAFNVPYEPLGGYNTQLSQNIFPYEFSRHSWERLMSNTTSDIRRASQRFIKGYNASLCADTCNQWTDGSLEPSQDSNPYFDDAFPVCSMFIAYELRSNDEPMAMVCDTFSSIWSTNYQTRRELDGMMITEVSVFTREDYQYPAICANKQHCRGGKYYPGGDCSGWGPGKCQRLREEPLADVNGFEDKTYASDEPPVTEDAPAAEEAPFQETNTVQEEQPILEEL